ncbi:hypothetical protein M441DRAFT_48128 [Trichoderma asperellum CBS 433.97]|uniref:Uncharacterized protein n=1 Tax=Trichoderma asperellum (strain ATCC 204424 / CBS 433.97 / NBRC 101777) TaxID=1042311 RepID=A0A2T3Z648_TRIA4|nr:hypothetical protein M441DRAFT_48128 [Trichoderma asperellum CBS 433.97]PTB40274.1 hypothetical protein M441DRAFT_48128 [Trichoderma asperellum CBS 433.97]
MKTGAIILSLFAALGLAAPMEQAQQANDAQMMQQVEMAAKSLFDPPRNGNGNIIADIFDTAACILGSFIGARTCPSSTIIQVPGDDHHNDNSNSSVSTSTSYQYTYSTDSDGNYHIQIIPGGSKSSCTYTVSKNDVGALANTINQLAAKCINN